MIGIVIVAHGGLASEYLAAVEHVVGRQGAVRAIPVQSFHDRSLKEAEICRAADEVDTGDGVVIVTDMFGGSPANLSMAACQCSDRRFLYGANLPMLVKLFKSRRKPIGAAVEAARVAGRKYLDALDVANGANGAPGPAPLPASAPHP
ncbi:MAG: PTS sugar transporter subunit IIA [Shimia sp.]